MGKTWVQIAVSFLLVWSLSGFAYLLVKDPGPAPVSTIPNDTVMVSPKEYTVRVLVDGVATEMSMTDYLTGVLISEVPADFHMEAKKAQAVAARTYTLRMQQFSGAHAGCDVCNDPGCCQGYLTDEAFFGYGGTEEAVSQARQAVMDTANMVMTYQGELILATYFSSSGGRTEDAVAVWGQDLPYLQAVDSPGEENTWFYTETVRFTPVEFENKLGRDLEGTPESWFGNVTYTEGYGINTMDIGGVTYKGNDLRFTLGLNSTRITVTALSDTILITTRGFGHRVGMSQYGADAMGKAGKTWQEILTHYYQGVDITEYGKGQAESPSLFYTVYSVRERMCSWNSGSSSQK